MDEAEQRVMVHLESLGPPATVEAAAAAEAPGLAGSAPAEASTQQPAQPSPEKRDHPERTAPPKDIDGLRACVARYVKDRKECNVQPLPPYEMYVKPFVIALARASLRGLQVET